MMHSFGTAVAYLKPSRISKMEFSTKVVTYFLRWHLFLQQDSSRKFYVRRNNNKVDSIETGRITIARLLS